MVAMEEKCKECGGEVIQEIKPDAPEYTDWVCKGCGLVQETVMLKEDAKYSVDHAVLTPRKTGITACQRCGAALLIVYRPRGGRTKEFCDPCAGKIKKERRRKRQRKFREKRKKITGL